MEAKINAGNKTRTGHTELYIMKESKYETSGVLHKNVQFFGFFFFKERDTKVPHIFNLILLSSLRTILSRLCHQVFI